MKMTRTALLLAALAVLTALLLAGCGDGDAGLSREEVREIVRDEMADAPAPAPGLTSADVEEAIRSAMAEAPQPEPGLTAAEAERIARGVAASIPPKSAAHYNREEAVDGQWYVFIVDENDLN